MATLLRERIRPEGRSRHYRQQRNQQKPELGPRKHGKSDTSRRNGSPEERKPGISDTGRRNSSAEDMNAGRRNGSAEDRKPARSKDTDHAEGKGSKDAPVQDMEKARGTIAALATEGSTRRDKSPRMPTRSKDT